MWLRRVHVGMAIAWTVLTLLRQMTDLIGRLWLTVLADLFQMSVCISLIFALMQRRRPLLVLHTFACAVLILINTLLVLWWLDYLGDHTRPVLSLMLPFSFSFWLKFTPFCHAFFDLEKGKWVQMDSCWLRYTYIEASISIVHATMPIISLALSLVNLYCKWKSPPPPLPTLPLKHEPAAYAVFQPRECHSGYSNSVYEESPPPLRPPRPPTEDGVRQTREDEETAFNDSHQPPLYSALTPAKTRRFVRGGKERRRSDRVGREGRHGKDSHSHTTNQVVVQEKKKTSLITFDLTSPDPIHVQELESPSEESSIDDFVVRGPSRSEALYASQRVWDTSQHTYGSAPQWEDGWSRQGAQSTDSAYGSALQRREYDDQPGLPLSTSVFPRSSSFHIRPEGGSLVGGHYHSVEELHLVPHLPRGPDLLV